MNTTEVKHKLHNHMEMKNRLKVPAILIAIVIQALLWISPPAQAQIVTNRINPLADAHVISTTPTKNLGTAVNIYLRTNQVAGAGGEKYYAFFKFGLTGVSNIGTASLRLYTSLTTTGSVMLVAYSVADTNWTETGITWNTMPPASNQLASQTISVTTTNASWYEFDVRSFISGEVAAGRKFASLSLVNATNIAGSTNIYASISSKEAAANKPELAWTTNSFPTVSVTSPTSGTILTNASSVAINASASDTDGTISKVDFYVDGVLLGTDLTSPYSTTWSTSVLGSHVLTAKAMDNRGAEVTSSNVTVTLTHPAIDSDLNGVSDLLEDITLTNTVQFMATPFVVTGAIEAEQFDKGGQGNAYNSSINNATTDYRNTRVSIEVCTNDIGLGYAVTKLKQGDWLKYTFQVRTAGYYTVESRVSAGSTGGTFKVEFGYANSTSGYQTPAITVAKTNWHSVSYGGIYLTAGVNYFKLLMNSTNSGGDGYVGKFNYVSVYPTITPYTFPTYTNVVSGLYTNTGTNFLYAQLNSSNFQNSVNAVLGAGGGVVKIPAGTYYFAQNPVLCNYPADWEALDRDAGYTSAIRINGGHNLRITGDSATNTILKAQNRSTTLIDIVNWNPSVSQTNFSIDNLTFEGAPHTRTNGLFEPGWFSSYNTNTGGGGPATIGCHIVILGRNDRPTYGVSIQNCIFKNTARPILIGDLENVLIRSNSFLFYTGEYPSGLAVSNVLTADGVTYNSSFAHGRAHVGIMGSASTGSYGIRNAVITENYFNGSVSGNGTFSTNGLPGDYADYTDGIVWLQGGGNWFFARNTVDNYVLEGTAFQGGPLAMVGNIFNTYQYTLSTCALQLMEDLTSRSITQSADDLSYSFIGNYVRGGRSAVFGVHAWSSFSNPLYNVHVCGNDVGIDGPNPAAWWGELDGALAWLGNCGGVNMAGNTFYGDGQGFRSTYKSVIAEIHKNDFKYATTNAISFEGPGSNTVSVVISKNLLGQGVGVHLHATNFQYSTAWNIPATNVFLIKDTYYNGTLSPVTEPVLYPAGIPVNIQY